MSIVGVAFTLVIVAGPLLLGLAGWTQGRVGPPTTPALAWDWRLTIASTLLYVLAFNLVFFLQELFLVIPKALTPGLHPTLFHNNHDWTGHRPVENLLQGTGALATFTAGLAIAVLLARRPPRSPGLRLFMVWLAFHGLFMSLAQVVVGALIPANDVGRAMDYLRLGAAGETLAALVALAAIAAIGMWLARPLLGMASASAEFDGSRRRMGFIFRTATLPAFAGVPLILPFRAPESVIELLVVPLAVTIIGIGWVQAGAWLISDGQAQPRTRPLPIGWPAVALVVLLVVFQLWLRPGVRFY
jgi:hypothetical protein